MTGEHSVVPSTDSKISFRGTAAKLLVVTRLLAPTATSRSMCGPFLSTRGQSSPTTWREIAVSTPPMVQMARPSLSPMQIGCATGSRYSKPKTHCPPLPPPWRRTTDSGKRRNGSSNSRTTILIE